MVVDVIRKVGVDVPVHPAGADPVHQGKQGPRRQGAQPRRVRVQLLRSRADGGHAQAARVRGCGSSTTSPVLPTIGDPIYRTATLTRDTCRGSGRPCRSVDDRLPVPAFLDEYQAAAGTGRRSRSGSTARGRPGPRSRSSTRGLPWIEDELKPCRTRTTQVGFDLRKVAPRAEAGDRDRGPADLPAEPERGRRRHERRGRQAGHRPEQGDAGLQAGLRRRTPDRDRPRGSRAGRQARRRDPPAGRRGQQAAVAGRPAAGEYTPGAVHRRADAVERAPRADGQVEGRDRPRSTPTTAASCRSSR